MTCRVNACCHIGTVVPGVYIVPLQVLFACLVLQNKTWKKVFQEVNQFLSVIVSKSFINTSFREHANKSMFLKKKQEQSQLMWLLGDTLLKHFCGNRCAVLPLCVSRCQAPCWSRCPHLVEAWVVLAVWEEWRGWEGACFLHSFPPSILRCSAASIHLTYSFSWWENKNAFQKARKFLWVYFLFMKSILLTDIGVVFYVFDS